MVMTMTWLLIVVSKHEFMMCEDLDIIMTNVKIILYNNPVQASSRGTASKT